jgi:DNA-binding NarL/FixJ family response regulator
MRLTSADYESLIQLLPRLYQSLETPQFRRRALQVIRALIAADNVAWIAFAARPPALIGWQPLETCGSEDILVRMAQGLASHPFMVGWDPPSERPPVVLLTDAPRRLVERHRREYADVYAALDFRYAMFAVIDETEGCATGVTLARRLADFADRDRVLLAALVPHLQQSLANARLVSARQAQTTARCADAGPVRDLTPREQEVALWLARGKSNVEIGLIVGAGTRTIEKHVEAILRKLGSVNRTSAAVALAAHGFTFHTRASERATGAAVARGQPDPSPT